MHSDCFPALDEGVSMGSRPARQSKAETWTHTPIPIQRKVSSQIPNVGPLGAVCSSEAASSAVACFQRATAFLELLDREEEAQIDVSGCCRMLCLFQFFQTEKHQVFIFKMGPT
jgi:hypothetical protein